MDTFLGNVKQLSEKNKVPTWFHEFYKHLSNFSTEFTATITALQKQDTLMESQLAVQKTVTNRLDEERKNLESYVGELEADLEDLRQYSRRTNLLIHGIAEDEQESTDNKVMEVFKDKLGLDLTLDDVGRTHRLGRKAPSKKRPIIARFNSYRKRKMVFDAKRKLKGTGIVITENLTRTRYELYKKCIQEYGRENVYTLDGRIFVLTGKTKPNGQKERLIITREEDLS